METSSPLSLFEAVFKVIEDRLPFGRHIVTIMSALMGAVIIVFCVQYLFAALAVTVKWASLSLKAKAFAPLPLASTPKGILLPWWQVIVLLGMSIVTAYNMFGALRKLEKLRRRLD